MKFSKEFKEAVTLLPSSEKDKLLLRLLKKDLTLVNRLHFELLENKNVDEKRMEMYDRVKSEVKKISREYYSLGYLMMEMRWLSGEITEHVNITKDKFGEVSLNLLMLNEVIKYNQKSINEATAGKAHKISLYIIARAFKILILISNLHEDYRLDFEEQVVLLGNQIGDTHHLIQTAIYNGLDVNWLVQFQIPEDIKIIHKEIRANGFLR